MKYSIVIPVYKNADSIPRLLLALDELSQNLDRDMEAVFVIDGSPDNSVTMLQSALPTLSFPVQLVVLSRNFGSFPAIRTGLSVARGEFFGVMAADLQEPPALMLSFFEALSSGEYDITIDTRTGRHDPFWSRIASSLFWKVYRHLIVKEMPSGGVDVFGCNRAFRDQLLQLEESRSSLVALIFWLGFRRKEISYTRQERREGKSGWTFRKKFEYMLDSIFAFTDYPIRLLMRIGFIGTGVLCFVGLFVLGAKLSGYIHVDGFTTLLLTMILFEMINLLALGLVGTYAWRAYENTKKRPLAIILSHQTTGEKHHV